MFLLLGSFVFLALALIYMGGEAYEERDWPRHTWGYGVLALALCLFCIAIEL